MRAHPRPEVGNSPHRRGGAPGWLQGGGGGDGGGSRGCRSIGVAVSAIHYKAPFSQASRANCKKAEK